MLTYSVQEFLKAWAVDNDTGVVLTLEPGPDFEKIEEESHARLERGFSSIFPYLVKYKRELTQVVIALIITSILQLMFPFLTKSIVDTGIRQGDVGFIYLILFAQLMIFLGKTSVEMLRSYIMLHVSTRININLLTDFFIKLMRLPLGFFDAKMVGDILQRINDHKRVEVFLTSSAISVSSAAAA